MELSIRQASASDISALQALIELSVRGLQSRDYTGAQIEAALRIVFGVDTQLIADGTYYVVERGGALVGCGGWSKRRTLYGSDHCPGREDRLLDPRTDAAKIRAFFVHPQWARRGIGSLLLDTCEAAARAAGFRKFEMGSTLTGVPLYRARGYAEMEKLEVPLGPGAGLPIVRMAKVERHDNVESN